MTLIRAAVAICQVVLNQLATTPPHKAPENGRYKTKGHFIFSLAPLVFWLQRPLLYVDTTLELLTIAHTFYLALANDSPPSMTPFCPIAAGSQPPTTPPNLYVTPLSFLGIILVTIGTLIRLSCYKYLGDLFTFDLCVKPDHKLVTTGPYSFVRHPAYLGSLCLTAGLTFTGLTRGSWIVECAVPQSLTGRLVLFALGGSWWIYTAGVGWTRCIAEDQQMKRMFSEEWDMYASRVRYWFVPGLV